MGGEPGQVVALHAVLLEQLQLFHDFLMGALGLLLRRNHFLLLQLRVPAKVVPSAVLGSGPSTIQLMVL